MGQTTDRPACPLPPPFRRSNGIPPGTWPPVAPGPFDQRLAGPRPATTGWAEGDKNIIFRRALLNNYYGQLLTLLSLDHRFGVGARQIELGIQKVREPEGQIAEIPCQTSSSKRKPNATGNFGNHLGRQGGGWFLAGRPGGILTSARGKSAPSGRNRRRRCCRWSPAVRPGEPRHGHASGARA